MMSGLWSRPYRSKSRYEKIATAKAMSEWICLCCTTADPSTPGISRGTCSTSSGVPATVEAGSPNAYVIYSNIKVGPINSTFSAGNVPSSSLAPDSCIAWNRSFCLRMLLRRRPRHCLHLRNGRRVHGMTKEVRCQLKVDEVVCAHPLFLSERGRSRFCNDYNKEKGFEM